MADKTSHDGRGIGIAQAFEDMGDATYAPAWRR